MTFEQLEALGEVTRTGSVSAAAKSLSSSQPTVAA